MVNRLTQRQARLGGRAILLILVVGVGTLTFIAANARAGNTWDGGGTTDNWSDNNNWSPDGQPGYGTLTFSGATRTTNIDDNITAMNILLWTGSSSWTLNQGGGTVLSLFDFGGGQAKVENQSTGLVTINLPITFAANNGSPPNPFGEINAVNGDITFGTGTLTVNGSSVNGIKLFGNGRTTTFNNTVSASGKWFGLTASNTTMAIGGTFTSGDIYVMNGGTLNLNSGASVTTSAIRLGGDFGNTGNQNQTLGGTMKFTVAGGGQSFGSTINTVTGNSSGALLIDSTNTSGTNTISGNIFLDSNLRVQQASGGALAINSTTVDIKAQTLSVVGSGGNVNISSVISNSIAGGQLVVGTNGTAGTGGTVTLSNANTYSGETFIRNGTFAFTSTGSSANSTMRLGSTSGANVDANINFATATGGTTISSTINPVSTSGSGNLTLNSQNTSGTNTYSGHFGLDRNFTVTQSAGGTLNITQARSSPSDTVTGADIKGFTLTLTSPSGAGGTIVVSGDIYNSTGSGKVTVGTGASITSTVTLSGNNTYTGNTTVQSGSTLNINSATALGTGGLTSGGNFTINNTSGGTVTNANNNTLSLSSGSMTFTGTNSLNFGTGAVSLPSNTTRTITVNANTLTLGGVIAQNGTAGVTKAGAGTLALTNSASTYSGTTTINGGTLEVTKLANGTSNSSIGNPNTQAAVALVISGGTLRYVGGGDSTNRLFTFDANGATIDASGSANAALSFSNSGNLTVSGTGNRTLTLTGASTGGNTMVPVIPNPSSGITSVTKSGAGKWATGTVNTYTGVTTITGGVLNPGALADNGTASGIGAGGAVPSAADLVLNGGTLQYTGTAVSTNRLFSVGTSGGTIEASGSGAVNFSGSGSMGFNSQSGARTLNLTGSNTGDNILAAAIGDNGGATSVNKTGVGTWVLSGISGYTGATSVTQGTLRVTGSIANSSVTASSAGTIGGSGTTGPLTVDSGGAVAPGNSVGTLTSASADLKSAGTYVWEISNATAAAGTGYDLLSLTGAVTVSATSGSKFTVQVTSSAPVTNWNQNNSQVWTIASGGSAVNNFSADKFIIDTTQFEDDNPTNGAWSIEQSGNDLRIRYTVPEPTAIGLLLPLCGLAAGRRSRRRRRNR
jgi:fibronectin-binding autotransporter adhesin